MACDQQCIDLIRWGLTIVVPAIFGLVGVVIGAWLTGRREHRLRRLTFIEKQINDFYSPMLGLRNEIHMRSQLRVRIYEAADSAWHELLDQVGERNQEELQTLSRDRYPAFQSLIEFDNRQLREELLPAYHQMAKLFR